MELFFISEDTDYSNFIKVAILQEKITIAPQVQDKAGYYDQAFLRF